MALSLTRKKREKKIHQIGIEPTSVAPEAAALSTELLVRAAVSYNSLK